MNARNIKIINGEQEKPVDNDDIFEEDIVRSFTNSNKTSYSFEKRSKKSLEGRIVSNSQKSKKR